MATEQITAAGPCGTSGREARVRALYEQNSSALLNFLTGLAGERHAAEDLLQETMLRVWRNLDTVPTEPESTRRWLFTVARRVAIDAVRSRKARPAEVGFPDLSALGAVDDSADTVIAADSLRKAVSGLSDAHRDVLSELYVHGRSTGETARRLGVPVGTVKSRAHYAMRILRDALAFGR
ncbi:RNA polymerase sigma factor [Paractinoplanes deccanensis]|uniref:RNA polymerase sigma factor n=1 Tax=Paractinoplanes deccanensis TaxID=113561 RepID=A0ABQ3Y345_9ACTN|nr:sigma-70 family RNA polymerase sigma factor [Actinoplanes deccanensis]GID74416.1 RNA polymerase sigma factor [Actinoplanes deccanensis]